MKFFSASCLGVLVSFFLLSLLPLVLLLAVLSGSSSDKPDGTVLRLHLAGQVTERAQDDYYSLIFSDSDLPVLGLNDLLAGIKCAENDPKIKGIYVDCGTFACGVSSARALRNALLDFRSTGKFVVAYGGVFSQTTYYIASAADVIALNPAGGVDWRGLSSTQYFYKDFLEKIGVEVEVVRVGKYKSFAEKYTNSTISEENEQQISEYLQSVWATVVDDVSQARQLSADSLNAWADGMQICSPADDVRKKGLADTLLYANEALDFVAKLVGEKKTEKLKFVSCSQLIDNDLQNKKSENEIAVVYASGSIDGSAYDSDEGIISRKMAKLLDDLRRNDDVKAVVLRINSPGGSAFGSEQIWHSANLLAKEKPFVVSMGDCAASGGYYIACAAAKIFAEPTTVTGSIGIFGIIPNVNGLMQKIGVNAVSVKTNDKSDMLSVAHNFSDEERLLMQSYVENGYRLFLKRCADGRHKTADEMENIAQGRVWTGSQALENDLVDELGGLDDAIACAAQMCNAENHKVVEYPQLDDMLTRLFKSFNGEIRTRITKNQLGENYVHFKALQDVASQSGVLALMPFSLEIK